MGSPRSNVTRPQDRRAGLLLCGAHLLECPRTGSAEETPMIYELRTYTLKQGSVPEVAKNSGAVGRDIRKDDYGKLEGYWITEIGPLNQVMHLWSYKDLN